jgi:hypothetical protein
MNNLCGKYQLVDCIYDFIYDITQLLQIFCISQHDFCAVILICNNETVFIAIMHAHSNITQRYSNDRARVSLRGALFRFTKGLSIKFLFSHKKRDQKNNR